MPASRPAIPSEPNLRRLGVGGSGGGGGDRLFRAQLVIALVLGFTILAVVLYLLRRPSGKEHAAADAGSAAASGSAQPGSVVRTKLEEASKKEAEAVKLAPVQRVRCSASPTSRGNEGNLCDTLPVFEEALAKAISENVECAPKTGKVGTLNYVLTLDFERRAINVFAGKSGEWKGPQAKRAAQCVLRALPAPQWDAVPHQYRYYMIGILATYAETAANEAFPKFDK